MYKLPITSITIYSVIQNANWQNINHPQNQEIIDRCLAYSVEHKKFLMCKIYSDCKNIELKSIQAEYLCRLLLQVFPSNTRFMPETLCGAYLAILGLLVKSNNVVFVSDFAEKYMCQFAPKLNCFQDEKNCFYFAVFICRIAKKAEKLDDDSLLELKKYIRSYKLLNSSASTNETPKKSIDEEKNEMKKESSEEPVNSLKDNSRLKKKLTKDTSNRSKKLTQAQLKNQHVEYQRLHAQYLKGLEGFNSIRYGDPNSSNTKPKASSNANRSSINPKPKQHKNRLPKDLNVSITRATNLISKSQPQISIESVIKHSNDFSYEKFKKYSESVENHDKRDQGVFSKLHEESYLKTNGYDTNTTWEKRKAILDQAVTYRERRQIINHLQFLIQTRVSQKDGASKFARAIEIWEHDINYVQNIR